LVPFEPFELLTAEQFSLQDKVLASQVNPATHKQSAEPLFPAVLLMAEQFLTHAVPFHWNPELQKQPEPLTVPLELGTFEQLAWQPVPFQK